MASKALVTIHGDSWNLYDIEPQIEWAKLRTWVFKKWFLQPALVHKFSGRISRYVGQRFDPIKVDLIHDGWSHDHCEICYWTLYFSDDEETGFGFYDGYTGWICSECHQKFIRAEQGAAANP